MSSKKKDNIINFPSSPSKLERQVEAILFAASEPLDIETIEKRIQTDTSIKKILDNLKEIYKNRGINLVCIKNKWSFRTAEDLSKLMALQKSTQKKLSKATVETLAIIVYHQPVTRSEIEEIRGVSFASNTLDILLELDWVRPAGRKDVPGKPIQYATTENFLNHFNIQKLSDLPTIDELGTAGLIDTSSIDKSIFGTGKFFKEQSLKEKNNIYEDIDEAIKKAPEEENKHIYLRRFNVYIFHMGNIGWTGIIIIAILVVILFGKGKSRALWEILLKVLKSFKKGMSDDPSVGSNNSEKDPDNNSENK